MMSVVNLVSDGCLCPECGALRHRVCPSCGAAVWWDEQLGACRESHGYERGGLHECPLGTAGGRYAECVCGTLVRIERDGLRLTGTTGQRHTCPLPAAMRRIAG